MAVCTPDTIGSGKPAQTLQKPLHIYAAALVSGASPRSRHGPVFPLMAAAHGAEERSGCGGGWDVVEWVVSVYGWGCVQGERDVCLNSHLNKQMCKWEQKYLMLGTNSVPTVCSLLRSEDTLEY